MTTQSTNTKDRRRRAVAVALVGIGLAGLATASASMLTVDATDQVASGVDTTPVIGCEGATATIATTPKAGATPDTAGAVPVDLEVSVDACDGWNGTIYLGDAEVGTFTASATPTTVSTTGIDSHDALSEVSVVLVAP